MADKPSTFKSAFDGIPVVEQGFPLSITRPFITSIISATEPVEQLSFLGVCPDCGAPIFGKRTINIGEDACIQYNCQCRFEKHKSIQDSMQIK